MIVHKLSVSVGRSKLVDVNDLHFEAGSFHAIVGRSGSGKTTLCRAMCGHDRVDPTSAVSINGSPADRRALTRACNYIASQLWSFPQLTTLETLHVRMRLSPHSHYTVNELICLFHLQACAGTTVGNLSAGERKRLQLAAHMPNPGQVIVVDEPTSELDAFNVREVLHRLQHVTHALGTTVVCTVHNLDEPAMRLFDTCTVMRDGKCTGQASMAHCLQMCALERCNLIDLVMDVRDCVRHVGVTHISTECASPTSCSVLGTFLWHQSIVYARTPAMRSMLLVSVFFHCGIALLFARMNPEYIDSMRLIKLNMQVIVTATMVPLVFASIVHPFRMQFFEAVLHDAVNTNRTVLLFLVADNMVVGVWLWIVLIVCQICSAFMFEVSVSGRLHAANLLCLLFFNNLGCVYPYLFRTFPIQQGCTQFTLACISVLSAQLLPVRALSEAMQTAACFMPPYHVAAVAYPLSVEADDDLGTYTPLECAATPLRTLVVAFFIMQVLWMSIALCREHAPHSRPQTCGR